MAFGFVRELAAEGARAARGGGAGGARAPAAAKCARAQPRRRRPAALHVGAPAAARRGWPASGRFDVVHQLNPVDVGREPRAGGRPGAARARALRARLGAVGARRGRTRGPARAARKARGPRARSSAGPTTLLLSTPAAGVAAGTAACRRTCTSCRPASTTAPGARRAEVRQARRCCSSPTSRSARASTCCWTPSRRSPRGCPTRACRWPATGRRATPCGAGFANRPLSAASSCSATSIGSASWRSCRPATSTACPPTGSRSA